MQTCYRHPVEETGVSCSSCGRPICTQCMTPTPVGMRCPECARQKTKVRSGASAYSASTEPRVTYAIIAINVLVFVTALMAGGTGTSTRIGWAYDHGYLHGYWVDQGEWWRMLTSGFLHDGALHLLFNMIGVFFLGQMLEPALGAVRFAAVYLASVFAGAFGALLLSPDAATVGASGAVFGLLGAAFVIMRRRGINPMQTFVGPIIILNLLITFANSGSISVGGHIGGLIGGGLCALAIAAGEERRSRGLGLAGCVAVGVASALGGVAAAAAGAPYF